MILKNKRRKKEQYVNDGRAPDTAEVLGIAKKKRKANASSNVKQSRRKKAESKLSFSCPQCVSKIESFMKRKIGKEEI